MKKLITLAFILSSPLFGFTNTLKTGAELVGLAAASIVGTQVYAYGLQVEQANCERQIQEEVAKFKADPAAYMGSQEHTWVHICLNQSISARIDFTHNKQINAYTIKVMQGSLTGGQKYYEVIPTN